MASLEEDTFVAELVTALLELDATATVPLELADKSELDAKVESMLNDEGYAKADFMVVQYIDYNIDAKDYSDD